VDAELVVTEPTVDAQIVHRWYSRPVFFVADVENSLRFYMSKLAFTKKWHQGTVCQVDHGECEIILCQSDQRQDKSRLFVELTKTGVEDLRRQLIERSIPFDKTWWGYDCIRITDPDGNELLFPVEE
jgi:hypothetical protein